MKRMELGSRVSKIIRVSLSTYKLKKKCHNFLHLIFFFCHNFSHLKNTGTVTIFIFRSLNEIK